jgi:hypothetical protein
MRYLLLSHRSCRSIDAYQTLQDLQERLPPTLSMEVVPNFTFIVVSFMSSIVLIRLYITVDSILRKAGTRQNLNMFKSEADTQQP